MIPYNHYTRASVNQTNTPWIGLGNLVDPNAPIADWAKAGGIDYDVLQGTLGFTDTDGNAHTVDRKFNRTVNYRSDNKKPLSITSIDSYKIHQPREVLEIADSISKTMGWPVRSCGSVLHGRKIWVELELPEVFELPGGDQVRGTLLGATSYDTSTGTFFSFQADRGICGNRMSMVINQTAKKARSSNAAFSIYHTEALNGDRVKEALGIYPTVWAGFIETAKQLASIKLSRGQATKILRTVYDDTPIEERVINDEQFIEVTPTARRVLGLYNGAGIGADMLSAVNTGWGLANAVTEEVDHFGSNRNSRLNSAWFGNGLARKQAVVDAILAL